MPTLTLFRHRFYNNDGTVAAGGKVYCYDAGTSTPRNTYTDSTGTTPNAVPVILDAKGEADIWTSGLFKINVLQSDDVQITGFPVDNLGAGQTSYDIAHFLLGKPTNAQEIFRLPMVRHITFDVNMALSKAKARVAATGSTTFNIAKNGTNFATMVFAAGATVATFVAATPPALEAGDWLTVTGPATADATLEDIGFVLCGQI